MKRDDALRIKDILKNIYLAEAFTKNISLDVFKENMESNFAVIKCIENIGEASRNVSEYIRNKYTGVPWQIMTKTRDRISHGYFDINLEKV